MAVEKTIPATAEPAATPNPEETSLRVAINPGLMKASYGRPFGTKYRDCPETFVSKDKVARGYGDYILSDVQNGDSAIFWSFAKNKTEEEANVPFRETTHMRNHPWPPILYALVLIPDYTFLRTGKGYNSATNEISEVVAPNHYVREVFVPGVNEGTKMVKREFFGPRPFNIPQSPVPVPTAVSYDINGVQGRFPECLHPRIELGSTRSGIAQVSAGVVSSVGGALEGQIFPATNFEEWAPYITSDTQELTGGGWYRVQWFAIPPPPPDVIVQ